jgi:hypothetical protein
MAESKDTPSSEPQDAGAVIEDLKAQGPIFQALVAAVAQGIRLAFTGSKTSGDNLPLKD